MGKIKKIIVCTVPGCENNHLAKGYCQKHYVQIRKHGKIMPNREKHIGCKKTECNETHFGNGYCKKHYRQICRQKRKLMGYKTGIPCKVLGCEKEHFAKGYCYKHYVQIRKHGKIMPDRKIHIRCKVPNCPGTHLAGGYCVKHYAQVLKHGSLRLENEANRPNKIIAKDKSMEIIVEDKTKRTQLKAIIDAEDIEKVRKHHWFFSFKTVNTAINKRSILLSRFIMRFPEKKLVFHKNGNPLDNRKSNLIVGTKQQSAINAKLSSKNTSGHKGVAWMKKDKRWLAYLEYNGRRYSAGYFEEKDKAIEARERLEEIYHNHLKFISNENKGAE